MFRGTSRTVKEQIKTSFNTVFHYLRPWNRTTEIQGFSRCAQTGRLDIHRSLRSSFLPQFFSRREGAGWAWPISQTAAGYQDKQTNWVTLKIFYLLRSDNIWTCTADEVKSGEIKSTLRAERRGNSSKTSVETAC